MPTLRAPRVPRPLLALALLPLLSLSAITRAQAPAAQPLFANLTMPLDISNAKIGSKFQARLIAPWSGNGCTLRLGALVQGHVSQIERRSKAAPRSSLSLVFDTAECNRQRNTPFNAILIALLGPPDAPPGMGKAPSLTDQAALTGSAATAAPTVAPSPTSGFRSVEASAAMNQDVPVGRTLPTQWKIGMVVDVPMNLTVGTVANTASIVWSTSTNALLEGQTTLILIAIPPSPPAPQPAPAP
jgi:hypothetical protein